MSAVARRLKVLDLRFQLKDDEDSFKASLEPELLQFGIVGASMVASAQVLFLVPLYFEELGNEDNPFRWSNFDARIVYFADYLFCLAVTFTFVALFWLRLWRGWCTSWNFEYLILGACMFVSFLLANVRHISLLLGTSPSIDFVGGGGGEGVTILEPLVLCVSVAWVSMYLPIRSCVLWMYPVVGMGPYTVLLVLVGSPYPSIVHIVVCLISLSAFFALHGVHRQERHWRKEWLAGQQLDEVEEAIQESSALAEGMESVAKYLCDIVIKLTADLQAAGVENLHNQFFGTELEGRCFTEMLAPCDRDRFMSCVDVAAKSRIPQCLLATLQQKSKPVEANMLIVASGKTTLKYLIGITVNAKQEQLENIPDLDDLASLAADTVINMVRAGSKEKSSKDAYDERFDRSETRSASSSAILDSDTYVLFDALSPNMTFTYASPAWTGPVVCPEANRNIAALMSQESFQTFREWLSLRVGRALGGEWINGSLMGSMDASCTYSRMQGKEQGSGRRYAALLCVTFFDPAEMYDSAVGTYVAKLSVVNYKTARSAHVPSVVGTSLPVVDEELDDDDEQWWSDFPEWWSVAAEEREEMLPSIRAAPAHLDHCNAAL